MPHTTNNWTYNDGLDGEWNAQRVVREVRQLRNEIEALRSPQDEPDVEGALRDVDDLVDAAMSDDDIGRGEGESVEAAVYSRRDRIRRALRQRAGPRVPNADEQSAIENVAVGYLRYWLRNDDSVPKGCIDAVLSYARSSIRRGFGERAIAEADAEREVDHE